MSKSSPHRALPVFLLVLGLGLVFSLLAAHQTQLRNAGVRTKELTRAAVTAADLVMERINLYQYGLRGMRGVVLTLGADKITRDDVYRYGLTRDLELEFPGARGFGFIRMVPRADVDAFLASARRNTTPQFAIRQIAPHDGDLFVIELIEPLETNQAAVGLDIASETNRRTAALEAARTGQVQMTGPITLVQATGLPQQSSLILMPIYSTFRTPATEEERVATAIGWSYAPLTMPQVVDLLHTARDKTSLEIWDKTDPDNPQRIFGGASPMDRGLEIPHQGVTREVFGRLWEIRLIALPAFEQSLNLTAPGHVLGGGVTASLLLAALVGAIAVNRQKARELAEQQSTFAAIVKGANDAIIAETLEGTVTAWNEGATRMFGYSAPAALGQRLADIIPADDRAILDASGQPQAWSGHFITKLQKNDGSLLDVSIGVSPIFGESGEPIGRASTIRDISREKEAEQKIRELNATLEQQVIERTSDLEGARRMLRTVLDAVPSMIGYWDKNLVNLEANKAYHDWFGLPPGALRGMRMQDLLTDGIFEENEPQISRVLRGETLSFERRIRRPFGKPERHALIYYLPDMVDGEVRGLYVVVHDVSELVDARLKLSTALLENQVLLDTINEQFLYSVADVEGTITDVNEKFTKHSGYQREEIVGQNYRILSSSTHPSQFWQDMWRTVQGGGAWHGDILNRTKDGHLCWLNTVIAPFIDPDGKTTRYIALQTDITARKNAEAELARLNDLLSNVLRAASDISIIASDPSGVITVFNTGAERMLGYAADEMVGKATPAALHLAREMEARGSDLSAKYQQPIGGFRILVHEADLGATETREWTYVRKDGTHLSVLLMVTAMRGARGEINGYLCVATDITTAKQQMNELTTTRDQLVMAAAVARLGIWTWLIDEDVIFINAEMLDIYDLPPDHALQMSYAAWRQLIHPDDIAALEADIGNAATHGGSFEAVFRVLHDSGKVTYVQARGLTDTSGGVRRMVGINRDITEQREIEATLRHAKEEADAANAAKSTFIANISHEIRTPMNAVIGMLQLVRRTELSTRQLDYIQKAQSSASSMLVLLNDVLDFSKASADMMRIDAHEFVPEELFYDLASVLSGSSSDKDVEVIFDIDPDMPKTLVGDRVKLLQIMVNLAGNALKFTEAGLVEVGVNVIRRDGEDIWLRFSVSDTGIGIDTQQRARIFEGFVQAEVSTSRRYGGTGLGLFICKKLVELMGGDLLLDSEIGRGSRFWFDIPLQLGPAATAAIPAPRFPPLRVLVVDDTPEASRVIARSLTPRGFEVTCAADAEEAIALVHESAQDNRPWDLILMDLRLPGMDGLTAAERLRADADPLVAAIPVVLVTAFRHRIPMRESAPGTAVLDVLAKPFSPRQLVETVERAIARSPHDSHAKIAPTAHRGRLAGVRLLVVEDNAINRQVAFELLTQEEAVVTLAEGGLQGVAMVVESGQTFDAVLMDVQMPDFDGLEATRRIRADRAFATLPIIAMTANVAQADRTDCRQAGMDAHVGKPLHLDSLIETILQLLPPRPTDAAASSRPAAVPAQIDRAQPADDPAQVEPMAQVLERFGGASQVYFEMYGSFHDEIERLSTVLETQVAQGKAMDAAGTLHTLKGLASTMGAAALARKVSALEAAVRADPAAAIPAHLHAETGAELRHMLKVADTLLRQQLDAVGT
ncbi:PAS domain S-box protein [Xanthobacter sp. KR7-65]|uniref:PAS domain S-box protein n=1 Tax=Xanthobacter sp. KR7-65 TaxID=3156612 RepID=UPI0032B4612E